MKKAHFLLLFFVGVLFLPPAAFAIEYTAKRSAGDSTSSAAEKEESKEKEDCSKLDLMQIDKFDEKAAYQNKKYEKLIRNRPHVEKNITGRIKKDENLSAAQTRSLGKDLEEVRETFNEFLQEKERVGAFFESEEYKKMKPIYLRCDRKMPELNDDIWF